jgi:hypothetical protein
MLYFWKTKRIDTHIYVPVFKVSHMLCRQWVNPIGPLQSKTNNIIWNDIFSVIYKFLHWSHWGIFSVSTECKWYWKLSVSAMSNTWQLVMKIITSVLNNSTFILTAVILRILVIFYGYQIISRAVLVVVIW